MLENHARWLDDLQENSLRHNIVKDRGKSPGEFLKAARRLSNVQTQTVTFLYLQPCCYLAIVLYLTDAFFCENEYAYMTASFGQYLYLMVPSTVEIWLLLGC
ncbi:hypothetical protein T11_5741 [Trichinella zimbabwensis]|uniref:Uncharacterized protein n=1 Tax=Trichinella zimbabwensis TaxID=268475 RepID=A0A0V1H0E9_9BILA|nr:hypothetical protein T11_5741 [Trichinella zimbabwensis]